MQLEYLNRERINETDYLWITKKGRKNICKSYLGKQGGRQKLYVSSSCGKRGIKHEIMHAMGFYHEHARKDRDDHLIVNLDNIINGKEKNFKICTYCWTFKIPYDFRSIMHYRYRDLSKNGLPTLLPKNGVPKEDLGNTDDLTASDEEKIRKLYNCKAKCKHKQKIDNFQNSSHR